MEVPRHWRMKHERYNLRGTYDPESGRYFFGHRRAFDVEYVTELYSFGQRKIRRSAEAVYEPAQR
ncbi:MAG TPA: hypothetical protein ENI95_15860 [Chloroflexi bacterium]|nr:hypothetical protein [Chloroflexota bacterium]